MMSKGSKEALIVLIVTHVTQVERVEIGVCVDSYGCPRRFLGLTHVFLACRVPWVSPMATGVTINH